MQGRCSVLSATVHGVEAVPVEVEVFVSSGLPSFSIVGMPDAAIQEARERVRAAVRNCGYAMPTEKVVVNLAPGSLKKSGSGFDMPIAVAMLAATGQIDPDSVAGSLLVGELSLEGAVRPVPGLLAHAVCARSLGVDVIGADPEAGAALLPDMRYRAVRTLADFREGRFRELRGQAPKRRAEVPDYADIAGHDAAKRALQIAAVGGHGILMMGPPGSGKTMLASRLPSILPPLDESERLSAAVVHSVAGGDPGPILEGIRPFRAPHHSATAAGLIGGGSPVRPGEVSLAHCGVLFLDELPEFKSSVLQGMRQPMEDGKVVVTRADGTVVMPASFQVVAAANPCPCGYFGDTAHECRCSAAQVRAYRNRIGGPVIDRIDLHIDVCRISADEVLATGGGTSSATLREGVETAREFAAWRMAKLSEGVQSPSAGVRGQGPLRSPADVVASCGLSESDREFFECAAQAAGMSGRSVMRCLSIARTIADMDESARVARKHVAEALALRLRPMESGW